MKGRGKEWKQGEVAKKRKQIIPLDFGFLIAFPDCPKPFKGGHPMIKDLGKLYGGKVDPEVFFNRKKNTIKAYYHGDFTLDCYTIVIGQQVYSMSEHPLLPHAVNMQVCDLKDYHPQPEKEIPLGELPQPVLDGIMVRLEREHLGT